MKYLLILGGLLLPSLAQASPLDEREYMLRRRQVAEVCQDLWFALERGKFSEEDAEDLASKLYQCSPDNMEWQAFVGCQEDEIPIAECPITEILFLDAVVLRSAIDQKYNPSIYDPSLSSY